MPVTLESRAVLSYKDIRYGVAETYTEPDGLHHPLDMGRGPRVFGALNRVSENGIVQRADMCFSPIGRHPLATAEHKVGEVGQSGHVEKRTS